MKPEVLFIVILAVVDIIIVYLLQRELKLVTTLKQTGIETTATVLYRHTETDSKKSQPMRFVNYAFDVKGTAQEIRQQVNEKDYLRMDKGAVVNVRYLPGKPDFARVIGTESYKLRGLLMATGFSGALTVVVIVLAVTTNAPH